MDKNAQMRMTLAATRERHSRMICRVFEVKIVKGKMSKQKKQHLDNLFKEAKWLRNSELAKDDIKLLDRKAKVARVKVGETFEERPLVCLSSQMRQAIVDQIKTDILNLSKAKKKGYKVGKLKFKSYCNCVPLYQYGKTYRIDFKHEIVTIQGFKKPFRVRGLEQLQGVDEIANAFIIRKPSGYYFHITTFTNPEAETKTGNYCGIDFGIESNLTLSNGTTYNIDIPETKGVKLASKRVNKSLHKNKKKKTNNHKKRRESLRRAYEKQNNIKQNLVNQIVHNILKDNDFIAIQDEMIAGWQKGIFGKQVQHSAMGSIKAKLKKSSKTHVVERSFASTQKCPVCGQNTKHPLSERSYKCRHCGYFHPSRDVKAAMMILWEAMNCVSSERRTKSPAELSTAIGFTPDKLSALKQEAQML